MVFKTWLTDLTKIQGVVNNIQNISAWSNGATGSLNSNVVNNLAAAINGLNLQQAQLVLSTKNLTQEQMNQVLVQAGLVASEDKIKASLVQSALAQSQLSAETQKAILSKAGLMDMTTGEIFATKACTKEELLNALAAKNVTGANAEAIISALGLTGANEGLSISFKLLSASIKKTLAALAANPLTWIALLAAGIYAGVKAYQHFNVTVEEANEALEESKSEYNSVASELDSLQAELTETSERIDELNSKESLSLVEEAELEKLKEATKELEYQIALKKEEQRMAAEETVDDAKDVYNTTVTSKYDTHDIHGSTFGNQVTVTDELENAIEEYKKQEANLEAARERFAELEEKKNNEGLSQGERVSSNHGHSSTTVGNEQQEYENLKTEIVEIEEAMTSASDRAYEMATYIENVRSSLQAVQDGGGMLSSDDLNMLRESTAYMDEYVDFYNYQQGILENFNKMSVTEQHEALVDKLKKSGLTTNEAQEIIDNTNDDDLEVIARIGFNKNETKDSVEGAIEEAQKIADEVDLSSEKLKEQTDTLNSSIDAIQSAYDTMQAAVEEYNGQGYLSIDTLQSLMELDDSYLACLVNENGQLTINMDTMNALAQAKLNEAEATAIAQAMTELNAIANGTAAASTVSYINGNANLIQSLSLLAGQYDNVTSAAMTAAQAQELAALVDSASAKDTAATADVMSGLNAKLGLIQSTRNALSTTGFSRISTRSSGASSASDSAAQSAAKTMEDIQKEWKEYLSKYLELYQAELDAGLIDFHTFLDKSRSLLDEYYRDGRIAAEDYWDSVGDLYQKELDAYDKVVSAVTRRLEDEIDSYQEQQDAIEKRYQDEISYLDTVIEFYEEQKNALQDSNDEYERQLALEQALYNFERATQQRTRKLYAGARGFIYVADTDAIRDADDALRKAKLDMEIANIEEAIQKVGQQQDALQKAMETEKEQLQSIIDRLEEYKDKWGEVADEYENSQNALLADQILGAEWETNILNTRLDTLEHFKNEYINIQQEIADAAWQSANAQAEAARQALTAQSSAGSSGIGTAGAPALPSYEPSEPQDKYWVYKTLGTYSTNGQASSQIIPLNGDGVIQVGSKYLVVRWLKGFHNNGLATSQIIPLGGSGVYERYAAGTTHAAKGLNLVGEAGILSGLQTAQIDYTGMFMNRLSSPVYSNIVPINRDYSTTVSIGDIHLHEVNDVNSFARAIIREMPNKASQLANRRS